MSLKSSFKQHLAQKYPQLTSDLSEQHISEQLISPFQVRLGREIITQIKNEVGAYWKLRAWSENNLSADFDKLNLRKPKNFSACMSYDFHLSSDQKLELIEINTNAAFLAMGLELYDFWKLPKIDPNFNTQKLVEMFIEESRLAGSISNLNSIAIFDENPPGQRLFIEFLLYKSIFDEFKIKSEIVDLTEVEKLKKFDLVYNRYTDFYLQNEASSKIKELFNSEAMQLTPHPWEYFLLADKQRLIDWNNQNEVVKPSSLLSVYDLAHAKRDEIWAQRKSLFFKPKNSYGGKQAYRGTSISTKAFDSIFKDDFIAQKNSIPAEIEVAHEGKSIKFKYDLRCYAYQDQVQMVIARLYQGQTTNLATPGGGFACVVFE